MSSKASTQGLVASTPLVKRKTIPKFRMSIESPVSLASKPKKKCIDLICEAINVVGVPRKGASAQAIRKFVLQNYEDSEAERVKRMVAKALKKGLDDGILSRPHSSKQVVGAVGSFILGSKSPVTTKRMNATKVLKPKQKKPGGNANNKVKENQSGHLSDSEVTINKGPKAKKKGHSSDSEIPAAGKLKDKQKQITTKLKKKTDKGTEVRPKVLQENKPPAVKLFKPKKGLAIVRKDVSDSEVEIKKRNKPLKSHSSDTEFETSKVRETNVDNKQKVRKNAPKSKIGAPGAKGKSQKIKAPVEANDKKQANETQSKKLVRKDSKDVLKDDTKKPKAVKSETKRGAK